MLFEFITYPHEICYRPNEVIGHCYQEKDFIESYTDSYSFSDIPFDKDTFGHKADAFDESCVDNDTAISFVKMELKTLLDSFIDSLGCGQYAFNLHNKCKDKDGKKLKPHFHIVIYIPDHIHNISLYDIYNLLGMYKYVHNDFEKRGKKYTRFVREYPREPYKRVYEYRDSMRSDRLRYLCHLDNLEKYQYDLQSPIASFDYANDPDVKSRASLTPFAMFLSYKDRYDLSDEVKWFEWLACAKLPKEPTDVRAELNKIKTDIHRYYVALYYRSSKRSAAYV